MAHEVKLFMEWKWKLYTRNILISQLKASLQLSFLLEILIYT